MKSIGEFAKENNVTIRALHHYEKLGLIIPYKVDISSGYRYYQDKQKETLNLIVALKNLGFSLNGIKMLLDNQEDRTIILQSLESKRIQAMLQKDTWDRNYRLLTSILNLMKDDNKKTFKEIIKVSIMQNNDVKEWDNMFRHMVDVAFSEYKDKNNDLYAMSIDIDNFGQLNNNFGYEAGDEVIHQVYSVIIKSQNQQNTKNIDQYTLVERTGGDEFKLIVKDNKQGTIKLAEKIISQVKELDFTDTADNLATSVTIGIACISDANSPFRLLHYSDTALLDAKNNNKGSYTFYKE